MNYSSKSIPKVFVGSSVEGLEIANAIQTKIESECEVTIWKDGCFSLSQYTLESLEEAAENSDFAIFVFSPDDFTKSRGVLKKSIRDNVVFEFGLFMGKLGRKRVYCVTPKDMTNIHLPSDLKGLNRGYYTIRRDNNWLSAVNTFTSDVLKNIKSLKGDIFKVKKFGMFKQEFLEDVSVKNVDSKSITLFFIHSRGWRENNHDDIIDFLENEETKELTVYLPDFLDSELMHQLKINFSDGDFLFSLIKSSAIFYLDLKKKYPKKVNVFLYNYYPTYSFYMFDQQTVIALYPTTFEKKNVPAFMVSNDSVVYEFVEKDLKVLKDKAKPLSEKHLEELEGQ